MIYHHWWESGIIYQIYPRSFQDSNGDGIGDLEGIRSRLDYLEDLGIDALWISPIFPSPMADFGYDVSDYTDVHPMFGTLDDLDRLMKDVHDRGMRLILDWVPNHTSDQHPWFLESRSSRDNPKRDWYVWQDPGPDGGPPNNWVSVFGGSAWEWDALTRQYYYHAFVPEQPDLNWRNPAVADAMHDTIRFWLDRGVDGIRVDAYWFQFEDPELRDNPPNPDGDPAWPYTLWNPVYTENLPEMMGATAALRSVFDEYDDRVAIGELYLPLDVLMTYYGTQSAPGFHLPFNFSLITDQWNARSIADFIAAYEAALPPGCWPNWVLGNHDKHRLATRIGLEQARVAAILLLTLRGTPTLYQGEELGMEDVPIPTDLVQDPFGKASPEFGRDPARTPMQWDASQNGGFSETEPWLPLAPDYQQRNVAVEDLDSGSMLSLYRALITLRRNEPALSVGAWTGHPASGNVLAYERSDGQKRFLIVLNLGANAAQFEAADPDMKGEILVSTHPDRVATEIGPDVKLEPNEGFVARIRKVRE